MPLQSAAYGGRGSEGKEWGGRGVGEVEGGLPIAAVTDLRDG